MLIAAMAVGSLLVWSPASRAGDTNTPPSVPPTIRPSHASFERQAEQLNLTDDQKPKVKAIEDSQRQKMQELSKDTSLSPEARQAKRKAVVEETAQQLKAVLTPEQFDKWQKTSPMGPRRFHPNNPPPGIEKAGSTNAPAVPPKK
jgi:Spy/CpxP family protein refolding chaperone